MFRRDRSPPGLDFVPMHELRKGKSCEIVFGDVEYVDNKKVFGGRSYPMLNRKYPSKPHLTMHDINKNKDLALLADDERKSLDVEIKYMANRIYNHCRTTEEESVPELPPMIELLRNTHGELVKRLLDTHDELARLKRLKLDGPPSKTSFWSKFKSERKEKTRLKPDTRVAIDGKECTVASILPLSNKEDMIVLSFYQVDALTSDSNFTMKEISASSLSVVPQKDFHSQLYEDVKNMNEGVAILETTGNTISTASMIHSNYSQLMQYLAEQSESDICLPEDTSPVDPIETLVLNERTMKHILLYVHPNLTIDNCKVLPENASGQPYQPTIYDMRNHIPPGTAVTCFEESEMDVELKKMFRQCPPITHKIYRKRKTRRARGASVPHIDSFASTKDLKKFGHASYFMPQLTTRERRITGWKSKYRTGPKRYHSHLFRGIVEQNTLTFCEMIARMNHPLDPNASITASLESFERGPRIMGYSLKGITKGYSLPHSYDSFPKMPKQPSQWFARFMNQILPCWWDPPPEREIEENWEYIEPKSIGRRCLIATCGCCMESPKVTSGHDIVDSRSGSGPFLNERPERIMRAIRPGPRHRNKWLLPKPTPPPPFHASWTTNYEYDDCGNIKMEGPFRTTPSQVFSECSFIYPKGITHKFWRSSKTNIKK